MKVSCCGKWREVDYSAADLCKELPSCPCADVGTTCDVEQDQEAFSGSLILLTEVPGSDLSDLTDDVDDELYYIYDYDNDEVLAFQPHSRAQVVSEDLWCGTQRTFREVFKEAIDKELASFIQTQSIDVENPSARSAWRKQYPESRICLQFLIVGTKNAESTIGEQKAKARLVVRTEVRASDFRTVNTRAVRDDEGSFSEAPSD